MANEILDPAKKLLHHSNIPSAWADVVTEADAVKAALLRFSADKPKLWVKGFNGDGTNVYNLSDEIIEWNDDLSKIQGVAWPWELEEPNWKHQPAWRLAFDPTDGIQLVLHEDVAVADTVVVSFYGHWTEAAVPAIARQSVAKLAAAYLARTYAARRAQQGDQHIVASVAVGPSEVRQWHEVAKEWERSYMVEIIGMVDAGAMIVTVNGASPQPDLPDPPGGGRVGIDPGYE